ncbi:hypothetical protein GQ457_11G002220 [Hibiscus cannabinus]
MDVKEWKGSGNGNGNGNGREDVNRSGNSAEKLAVELLWLAEKMVACGFGEEAVERWASASNLASLSLLAEPRLQGSLVKVSEKWSCRRKRLEKAMKRSRGKRRDGRNARTRGARASTLPMAPPLRVLPFLRLAQPSCLVFSLVYRFSQTVDPPLKM